MSKYLVLSDDVCRNRKQQLRSIIYNYPMHSTVAGAHRAVTSTTTISLNSLSLQLEEGRRRATYLPVEPVELLVL